MTKHDPLNPCGLDGFAFLEFSGPNKLLKQQFKSMGFHRVATHPQQPVSRYQQGDIQFIINNATDCQAQIHSDRHGPGVCAMGFRVHDAEHAFAYALKHGATPFIDTNHVNHGLPGIEAIGGSVIYFVDSVHQPFAGVWTELADTNTATDHLTTIDHLTHNVHRGNMDKWAQFYESIFNFKEIRYFDIKGKLTGLISRALASPCGQIKIPFLQKTKRLGLILKPR